MGNRPGSFTILVFKMKNLIQPPKSPKFWGIIKLGDTPKPLSGSIRNLFGVQACKLAAVKMKRPWEISPDIG